MISRSKTRPLSSGFTLVEMAVVLVIVGLILGTVIGGLNALMASQNIKQTTERQIVIKQALVNYIARNSHLPCPARITDADSVAGAGQANCANAIAVGSPVTAYIGAVPWVDLGLLAESVRDTYGRRFTYAVSASATSLTANTISGLTGNFSIYPSAADIAANTNQLNACPTPLTVCEKLAAVVLISHGANGLGGYSGSGNWLDDSTASNDEKANSDNNNLSFVVRDYSQQNFDDVVMWLKPEDLLSTLNASGAIKDYRAFNNQQFDQALISIASSTTRAAGGCVTSDSYDLAALPAITQLDAWGHAITVSGITFPHQFCPSGIGILTFTSKGMDTAQAADDQTRSVSEAEFVSYAIKFH